MHHNKWMHKTFPQSKMPSGSFLTNVFGDFCNQEFHQGENFPNILSLFSHHESLFHLENNDGLSTAEFESQQLNFYS